MNTQLFWDFGHHKPSKNNVLFRVVLHYRNTNNFDIDKLLCHLFYETSEKKRGEVEAFVNLEQQDEAQGIYTYECSVDIPQGSNIYQINFITYNKVLSFDDYSQCSVYYPDYHIMSYELECKIEPFGEDEKHKIYNFISTIPFTNFELSDLQQKEFHIVLRSINISNDALTVSLQDTQQGYSIEQFDYPIRFRERYDENVSFYINTNGRWKNDLLEEEKQRIARDLTAIRITLHDSKYFLRVFNDIKLEYPFGIGVQECYLYSQEAQPKMPTGNNGAVIENIQIIDNRVEFSFYVQLMGDQYYEDTFHKKIWITINIED